MKVTIDFTRKGMGVMKDICKKYGLEPKMTVNGRWTHEITEKQYNDLETAENNGYLRRIKL
jgi:hypothetical protein